MNIDGPRRALIALCNQKERDLFAEMLRAANICADYVCSNTAAFAVLSEMSYAYAIVVFDEGAAEILVNSPCRFCEGSPAAPRHIAVVVSSEIAEGLRASAADRTELSVLERPLTCSSVLSFLDQATR